ncbi:uracil catabolism protein 4 [Aspergillus awamori]|uniref:DUF1688-domain-containing protein n=2 Tax=Aspergillus TaxID=5052 RepID=A0A3F3PN77_9EURO|nr:DUF1688-domain-containing protein [Aspergillus welwitschiae]RDH28395.1 DUF1688-domain-containing protein [Aspergillus welwitschiae]GCB21486.1 uracil catabolism protein 4 [Aspergillus awamori]GKZ55952.1 hypothetical protein AnigIFM49718_001124 [Aspergillus niger]
MDSSTRHLLRLEAVRERANIVFRLAEQGKLHHYDYHPERLDATVDYVAGIIQRDFGPNRYDQIPPHGRWQHFDVGGVPRIQKLIERWDASGYDDKEKVRSLLDLFFVSVLLDAGAGDTWRYVEKETGAMFNRSEGIAVASLYMFLNGDFANKDSERKDVVHGEALRTLSVDKLLRGFQVDDSSNPLLGASARVQILQKLGESLRNLPEIFGPSGRPGQIADYLLATSKGSLDYSVLWDVLQKTLIPIWPSDRTKVNGYPIGDAWPLAVLAEHSPSSPTDGIQPFHKLTQWLAYSLKVPFERLLYLKWQNADLGTGLPEYRNGGLFIDMGVLTLKPEAQERGLRMSGGSLPCFAVGDGEIVEWRAMTVALLDKLHERILQSGKFGDIQLSLPQMLEAGSWKAGRELAAKNRPETKSSPILNSGDGTLF